MENRNYGVDFLRTIAMYLVVVTHVINFGGVLEYLEIFSLKYDVIMFLNIITCCAVDIFALISGYVGVKGNYRYTKILNLWLGVVFWGIGINLIFLAVDSTLVKAQVWKSGFLPIIFSRNWYFTAYFGLFFMIPILNAALNVMKEVQIKCIGVSMMVVYSIIEYLGRGDIFHLYGGYSVIWLIILYIIGGCIAKCDVIKNKLSIRMSAILFLLLELFTCALKIGTDYISTHYMSSRHDGQTLIAYESPLTVLAAILLLNIFSQIKVKGIAIKIIKAVSPCCFFIYIIHNHPLVSENLIRGKLEWLGYGSIGMILCKILLVSSVVFGVCGGMEYVRRVLFRRIGIDRQISKLGDIVHLNSK